ncbi:MAG: hypothetical protein JW944_01045 [Deltaproteobacteria bacterium]|nr:hypothetical protein [Deltaproteobacteria bacterium]
MAFNEIYRLLMKLNSIPERSRIPLKRWIGAAIAAARQESITVTAEYVRLAATEIF